jgi:hypothetical protein
VTRAISRDAGAAVVAGATTAYDGLPTAAVEAEAPVPVARAGRRARPGGAGPPGPGTGPPPERVVRSPLRAVAGAALALGGVLLGVGTVLWATEDPREGPSAPPGAAAAAEQVGPPAAAPLDPADVPALEPDAAVRSESAVGSAPRPGSVDAPAPAAPPAPTAATAPPAAALPPPPAAPAVPPPADAPGRPALTVLNNSRVPGLAERSARRFTAAGWPVRDTGNLRGRIRSTTVYYDPGQQAQAQALARAFPGVQRVLPRFDGLPGRGVTVVVTRDFG